MLEVKLKDDGALTLQKCWICDELNFGEYAQARIHEDGECTNWLVCQLCLALSPTGQAAKIRQHANRLRALAADMDTRADALPFMMPSHAEWAAANAEAEKVYLRDEVMRNNMAVF